MSTKTKVIIKKLHFPVDGFEYDAQIVRSVDGGKTFWNCGGGKYFKTRPEAERYKAENENL